MILLNHCNFTFGGRYEEMNLKHRGLLSVLCYRHQCPLAFTGCGRQALISCGFSSWLSLRGAVVVGNAGLRVTLAMWRTVELAPSETSQRVCQGACSGRHDRITRWVADKTDMYFLTVLASGGPRSRRPQGWFLVRCPFLACRWPPSLCPHMASCLCKEEVSGGRLVCLPSLTRTSVTLD